MKVQDRAFHRLAADAVDRATGRNLGVGCGYRRDDDGGHQDEQQMMKRAHHDRMIPFGAAALRAPITIAQLVRSS